MNTPKYFSDEVKKIKQEFAVFLKEENMEEKARLVVESLQEKEQNLILKSAFSSLPDDERKSLTKDFPPIQASLVDVLSYKMKKQSLFLWEFQEKYEFNIQELFSSWYSTNYDLELLDFSKWTEDVQFSPHNIQRNLKHINPETIWGWVKVQYKENIFPWLKEAKRDLPKTIAEYVYNKDTGDSFRRTLWLGDHHYANGKEWLQEAVSCAISRSLLNMPFEKSLYDSSEPDFISYKKHERLNNMLEWFINLKIKKGWRLEYSIV